jgi:cytochrome c553
VPRLAGQHFTVIVKELVDFRHGERSDFRMETRSDRHHLEGAQAIADVAAYASQLTDSSPAGVGPGDRLGAGAQLYDQLCQSCHGRSAQGDARERVPRLAGQHYEYLRRQIYDAVKGRRSNITLAHRRLLAQLDGDGIIAIADFLSRTMIEEDRSAAGAGLR